MKTVTFTTSKITTLEELEAFCQAAREAMPEGTHASTVYVSAGNHMTTPVGEVGGHLIEETLTDGSVVYNIAISARF